MKKSVWQLYLATLWCRCIRGQTSGSTATSRPAQRWGECPAQVRGQSIWAPGSRVLYTNQRGGFHNRQCFVVLALQRSRVRSALQIGHEQQGQTTAIKNAHSENCDCVVDGSFLAPYYQSNMRANKRRCTHLSPVVRFCVTCRVRQPCCSHEHWKRGDIF